MPSYDLLSLRHEKLKLTFWNHVYPYEPNKENKFYSIMISLLIKHAY
ncbi:hypothetical protein BVRB_5g120000 [Beta vulgaris subsp. vulgaris]|nr:hypothetical protein BVRB_5g120000 [Beta vulgaris subsp. vulgaris]